MSILSNCVRFAQSFPLMLAVGFFVVPCSVAQVTPAGVNTVNDSAVVSGGTYYNTPGAKTTFVNSAKTGLYLEAGSTVVGREFDVASMAETGNGGHLHFSAPGQIVRLDGNIDVNAVLGDRGYIGNGGKVTIESGFLYQNGQIFANGVNGGQVQMNVSAMTMGPNAAITAQGYGGNGGIVNVDSSGAVTIQQGAVVDTSGGVVGTFNSNLIEITGSVVNLDGVLQANGLGAGQSGGHIQLVGTDRITIGQNGKVSANGANGDFSVDAAGTGGNGGVVEVAAINSVENNGLISVNGGQGASFSDAATGYITSDYDGQGREIYETASGERFFKDPDTGVFFDACDQVVECPPGDIAPVQREFSQGLNGGNGGNAGIVLVGSYTGELSNAGLIEAVGGNGGRGQDATAQSVLPGSGVRVAIAGHGGNGGQGGLVSFVGNPSQSALDNVDVSGGQAGLGGSASVLNPCTDLAVDGNPGTPGQPGLITVTPSCPVTPPPAPKVRNPRPRLLPPFLVHYPSLGDTLPGQQPNLVSYTRSVFLARSPLPIVKRPTFTQVLEMKPSSPPPQPPVQRKKLIRGYW